LSSTTVGLLEVSGCPPTHCGQQTADQYLCYGLRMEKRAGSGLPVELSRIDFQLTAGWLNLLRAVMSLLKRA
jgi:hypothetical protein